MSSPATLLSVVCYGLQDQFLQPPKGQPNLKNYVKVLKKTTRWASQLIRVDFDGDPGFGKRFTCTLPRKGELLTQITLVVTMPDIYTPQQRAIVAADAQPGSTFLGPTYGWTNALGHAMINLVEFDIGGVNVDRMDGRFLEVYDELNESIPSVRAKNRMIQRIPNGFNATSIGHSPNPTVVYVPLPFWFSRGSYEMALPVDALSADALQLSVTLRPLNQLYYSPSRLDPRNPGFRPGQDVPGAMVPLQGGPFYVTNPLSKTQIYNIDPQQQTTNGLQGELIAGQAMPTNLPIGDTYLLCEYISLEDSEAVAFRSSQLDYRVEQHYMVDPQTTSRAPNVRIQLPFSNPVKDLIWVAQRPEVATYNAWFLFTRNLVGPPNNGSEWWLTPWWPNAIITNSDQALPAFRNAYSEPIQGAQLLFSNMSRFNHQSSPSLFRSLLPILHYRKAPLHDRYIYVYPFALAPGASDDISLGPAYNPRGFANFDKLPKKELHLTMAPDADGTHYDLTIYAYVSTYNVFRVFGGRGVMLFSY
jgi:hypothetical protein